MTEHETFSKAPERQIDTIDRVRFHYPDIPDLYANHNLAVVQDEVRFFMEQGFWGDSSIDLGRERHGVETDNPATKAVMQYLPGIEEWFKTIPRAIALYNIYNPTRSELYEGTRIGEQTQEWFKNIADARGIRSRSRVLQDLIGGEYANTESLEIASLACGAAQPVIDKTAAMINGNHSADVRLTLVDLDRKSTDMAEAAARGYGIEDRVNVERKNILGVSGIDLSDGPSDQGLNKKQFDVVEALGFLEYLKPDDQHFVYNGVIDERKTRAGAVTFLKNAYDCVKPGGLLVVGNMLDTHPELQLTLNVVQWPHIQPRSIEQMMEIIDRAKIGEDAQLDIYCPTDGVYAVYALRKPTKGDVD